MLGRSCGLGFGLATFVVQQLEGGQEHAADLRFLVESACSLFLGTTTLGSPRLV